MLPDPPWSDRSDRIESTAISITVKIAVMLLAVILDLIVYYGTIDNQPAWAIYAFLIFPNLMFVFLFEHKNKIIRMIGVYPLVSLLILLFINLFFGVRATPLGLALVALWTVYYLIVRQWRK